MTGVVDTPARIDADRLVRRVEGLGRFLAAVEGYVPDGQLVAAHTVVERSGQRLALSRDHTVVALAGSTGSGKSSLFNGLARMNLSPVGARRPTTGTTYACVWGPAEGASGLLDWLGVLPRHRFDRESELDGETEAGLRGLVLLDLPDFDSVEASHRAEVDRLLGLVDLVVWVVDPQKYADKLVHDSYLRQFHRHRDVTVVALNHADRLAPADVQRCLTDLRGLLDADGLPGVAALASSAYGPPGHDELRILLEQAVATRQAALHRLDADVDRVGAELSTLVGPQVAEETGSGRLLTDALAHAAGVPAVVDSVERTYRIRASEHVGWPFLRLRRTVRPERERATPSNLGSEPTSAQRAAVGLAVRGVVDGATGALPAPWPAALGTAARSRLDDLPDALDRVLVDTDLGLARTPIWWRAFAAVQWVAALSLLAGLGWLLVASATSARPSSGVVLLLAGVLLAVAVSIVSRPLVGFAARRAAARAQSRLRAAVAEVARGYVIGPVRAVLAAYSRARAALADVDPPRDT